MWLLQVTALFTGCKGGGGGNSGDGHRPGARVLLGGWAGRG